jgi:hypothetical protein
MALKALQHDAETQFSLEDIFDDTTSAAKLAWVNGWRNLPHIPREVQQLFEYPQQFAEDVYDRIELELRRRDGSRTGRLHIAMESAIPDLPARYSVSSDKQIVAADRAQLFDQAQLLRERQEGIFLVSYETPGGWTAIKKELLTEVLGAGRDARIVGLPLEAVQVLRFMCAHLVMPENLADQASVPSSIEKT